MCIRDRDKYITKNKIKDVIPDASFYDLTTKISNVLTDHINKIAFEALSLSLIHILYRLHDFGITFPPLRDCQEDIMPLAEFFRDMANRELECSVSGFSSEARKALLTHAWRCV